MGSAGRGEGGRSGWSGKPHPRVGDPAARAHGNRAQSLERKAGAMKSEQQRQTGAAGWRGGVIRRASWLAAMALSAGLAGPLDAEVIDGFHECAGWDGLNNPSGAATFECVEEQSRMAADFRTATDPAIPFNTFGNIYYSRGLPLRHTHSKLSEPEPTL